MTACPICKDQSIKCIQENLYDDRYGCRDGFSVYECQSCKHKFGNLNMSSTYLSSLYTQFYPRKNFNVEDHKPLHFCKNFSSWIKGAQCSAFSWVPEKVTILDIGCGFGESLAYHKARGCDVYGVEADENIKKVVDRYNFNVHVGIFNPEIYEDNFFDVVTMDQVIEHVTDPIEIFKNVRRILKPNGIFILSTPNADGWGKKVFRKKWLHWHTPYHLNFFSNPSLSIASNVAGLKIETNKTITHSDWLYYQLLHIYTYPRKGEASKFWSGNLRSVKTHIKILVAFTLLLKILRINDLITRAMDFLRLGDNSLIVL